MDWLTKQNPHVQGRSGFDIYMVMNTAMWKDLHIQTHHYSTSPKVVFSEDYMNY